MFKSHIILLFTLFLSCSQILPPDPQKDFKRLIVRTLCDNVILDEKGFYAFYWDGKNDSGQYVSPGHYRVELQFQNMHKEFFFEILDGGEPGKNNEEKYEYHSTSWNEFYGIRPNPFQVKSGTNVEFSTRDEGTLNIKFYFDKDG